MSAFVEGVLEAIHAGGIEAAASSTPSTGRCSTSHATSTRPCCARPWPSTVSRSPRAVTGSGASDGTTTEGISRARSRPSERRSSLPTSRPATGLRRAGRTGSGWVCCHGRSTTRPTCCGWRVWRGRTTVSSPTTPTGQVPPRARLDHVLRIGVTGGIGSGKSSVSRRLAELGATVIDADQVARDVVEVGQPALAAIRERFGDQ